MLVLRNGGHPEQTNAITQRKPSICSRIASLAKKCICPCRRRTPDTRETQKPYTHEDLIYKLKRLEKVEQSQNKTRGRLRYCEERLETREKNVKKIEIALKSLETELTSLETNLKRREEELNRREAALGNNQLLNRRFNRRPWPNQYSAK